MDQMVTTKSESLNLILENSSTKVAIHISVSTIQSLKKEFRISDNEVENYVASLIERKIAEHIGEINSGIFTEDETEKIEEDLKGLGYI